ncbi:MULTISPECIES: 3-phosphoshikimate 1-carboxyvinyltransferase [unclassified Bacillus (in: firmicutes)]|uniref:3-phosphoshikimate 1-carboxyvinyltransferase n=1 Tax=unclassified Bacillus (in: firmicutes) TaxID=185979 RepID=UPI000BEF1CCB|nr:MULTISPECIES: 3-phosphoshikimate 1-carboxyvinyltransferase [unclassified Bacillus (in: firmicutes)]PEJ53772.1 3-phosphoshikimate 1-carboxyvinyltransferase [Bacillus sp. AFS002410]PEL11679.1 3-phosphoshikimate 1-carboxyvinyltransferase [Bacillus sp. AFS017336]
MRNSQLEKIRLVGDVIIPGDKSISHRAIMFGSLAKGTTKITNFLLGEDCLSTIACFRKLGVQIEVTEDEVIVYGKGIEALKEPNAVLDVGNSGTTARLMMGILSGLPFHSVIIGDESIGKRPMKRVTKPLKMMGTSIDGREDATYTPISIRGGSLNSISYDSPVSSAQVKSSILLAGLFANGTTVVTEPEKSRDHTERMLKAFGCELVVDGNAVSIDGNQELIATDVTVPGDISSAAFFLVAGSIIPNSEILLKNVGVNPTRIGILTVLERMGANITLEDEKVVNGEPIANIRVKSSDLKSTIIGGAEIPTCIDELPILALAAALADGETIIKDAEELRVKETDRIQTVVTELTNLGVSIEATKDGMIIQGNSSLIGANVNSHGDHRMGMMLSIAALLAKGDTIIENTECIAVSFPNFKEQLNELIK